MLVWPCEQFQLDDADPATDYEYHLGAAGTPLPRTTEVNPITDNRNAPPKVEQQAGPPKIKRKPEEPWWAWAGICFGATLILMGLENLIIVMTGVDLAPIFSGPGTIAFLLALVFACAGFPTKRQQRSADTPVPARSKLYNTIAALLLACGGMLMTASLVIPAFHAALEAAAKAESDPGQWKEHAFADGEFSVSTPASWQPIEDPTAVGDIYLMDKARDLHLIATVIPKVDVAVSTGTELVRQRIGLIRWGVDAIETEEPTVSEVKTVPVVNVTGKTTTQGLTAAFHLRYFDYDEEWVELRSWSSPSTYSEHQNLFARIHDSVKAIR